MQDSDQPRINETTRRNPQTLIVSVAVGTQFRTCGLAAPYAPTGAGSYTVTASTPHNRSPQPIASRKTFSRATRNNVTVYAVVEAKRMSSAKARIAVVRRARSLSLPFLHTGGVRDGTVI